MPSLSLVPQFYDLAVTVGDTSPWTFTIRNSDGVVLNVSGYTFTLDVDTEAAPTGPGTQLFSLTGTILDAPNGVVQFAMSGAQAAQAAGSYFYDLTATLGTSRVILRGRFQFVAQELPPLWQAVRDNYDYDGLVSLTNVRDRSATTIDDLAGIAAADSVIALWPAYAQCAYDPANPLHVHVGTQAVIAMLWRRGGSASAIEQVKWDSIWGDDGLMARVRRTSARGHKGPASNSGVQQAPEQGADGGPVRGWSDPESMPAGYLSRPRSAQDTY